MKWIKWENVFGKGTYSEVNQNGIKWVILSETKQNEKLNMEKGNHYGYIIIDRNNPFYGHYDLEELKNIYIGSFPFETGLKIRTEPDCKERQKMDEFFNTITFTGHANLLIAQPYIFNDNEMLWALGVGDKQKKNTAQTIGDQTMQVLKTIKKKATFTTP